MIKFNETFTCDVCGGKITYPNFRIEWGYNQPQSLKGHGQFDFIKVCHGNCSCGIQSGKNYPITIGDIIFDQIPYSPQDTYNRLDDLEFSNPSLTKRIEDIKAKIFE